MRHKELRIALICYGGVSLAVYMHGVTKELWKLLRASRAFHAGQFPPHGSEHVYGSLLRQLREEHGLSLSVMTDIVAGASAGGINSVFLAQAIHSGQSLDPLTDLWLSEADIDVLLDPDARPGARTAKFWMTPVVSYLLHRPDDAISNSVSPETREEVREKLSRLIRSRWFEPPFSGIGLSRLLMQALKTMARGPLGAPLLPASHPLDLFVTTTDFRGRLQALRLHSPELVHESEHRLSIGFRSAVPDKAGEPLAPFLDLVFATRATSSFPGAFPPLQIQEISSLAAEENIEWESQTAFLERIMPEHARSGRLEEVALIDGSVLVNAPFADAMRAVHDRPAHREVDRRFVYVDPTPQPNFSTADVAIHEKPPGFIATIFGAISAIPREQPIRDNLEALETASRDAAMLQSVIDSLRPEIEDAVEKLFGRTLFLDRPTPKRLGIWRAKAHEAAWQQAGFAYHGYSQVKLGGIVTMLTRTIMQAAPGLGSRRAVADALTATLKEAGSVGLSAVRGKSSLWTITFLRQHDLTFRIRRLRLLAQRTADETLVYEGAEETAADRLLGTVYKALSLYQAKEPAHALGPDFPAVAERLFDDPTAVLDVIAAQRDLPALDAEVDTMIARALGALPSSARRRLLLAYLGFPFYDTVTLPLLRGEGSNEFNPAKVDRISPDDCHAIPGAGTLRGTEFYNFGAFFSRAYREHDYLWGRLHGAERAIDLVASTMNERHLAAADVARFKREAFIAILDEEETRLTADAKLIARVRSALSWPQPEPPMD